MKEASQNMFEELELGLLTRSALFFWELETLLHCKDLSFLLQPQPSSYNNRLMIFFFRYQSYEYPLNSLLEEEKLLGWHS